jgi:hypothetical protein
MSYVLPPLKVEQKKVRFELPEGVGRVVSHPIRRRKRHPPMKKGATGRWQPVLALPDVRETTGKPPPATAYAGKCTNIPTMPIRRRSVERHDSDPCLPLRRESLEMEDNDLSPPVERSKTNPHFPGKRPSAERHDSEPYLGSRRRSHDGMRNLLIPVRGLSTDCEAKVSSKPLSMPRRRGTIDADDADVVLECAQLMKELQLQHEEDSSEDESGDE